MNLDVEQNRQIAGVRLSLGGLVGVLRFPAIPAWFAAQIQSRYAAFLLPQTQTATATFDITVAFIQVPRATAQGREQQMTERPLVVTTTGPQITQITQITQIRQITIDRWDFAATLQAGPADTGADMDRPEQLCWRGSGHCEMNPFSLDCLLRVIWSVLLPEHGGALLHACGVRNGDRGLVFPGVSERGKTTLARKVPDPDDVLSDELVIVRASAAGDWRVYGTPFWGDFQRGGVSMHGFALRGLAFLAQASTVSAVPLPAPEAALRLLECWLCFESDDAAARRNLALAVRLCRETAVVEVRTLRETPLAEIVAQLERHMPRAAPPRPALPLAREATYR